MSSPVVETLPVVSAASGSQIRTVVGLDTPVNLVA